MDEFFYLDIFDLVGPPEVSLGNSTSVVTILNDDGPPPLFSINDVSLAEGNAGTASMAFTVTLTNPSPGLTAEVDYFTIDGPPGNGAVSPGDYTETFGTLAFAPGDTSENIDVPIAGDTADEPDELVGVILYNPVNASIADLDDGFGIGTITDDDSPPAGTGTGGTDGTGGTTGGFTTGGSTTTGLGTTPPVCVVPKLIGMKLAEAKSAIAAGGCALGNQKKKSVRKPKPGRVIKQSPDSGATLPFGSRVGVTLSKKPKKN